MGSKDASNWHRELSKGTNAVQFLAIGNLKQFKKITQYEFKNWLSILVATSHLTDSHLNLLSESHFDFDPFSCTPVHNNGPIKHLTLTCLIGLSRVKKNKIYYRVLFRATLIDVYYLEHHANDKARVYDVIYRVKEYFKIR